MKMRAMPLVALNAQLVAGDASYRSAGIYAYIINLLRHLPAALDAMQYLVLLGRHGQLPDQTPLPVRRSRFSTSRPVSRILWEQLVLPGVLRRRKVDLLHLPAYVGPWVSACPQVVNIHDLSFLHYPTLFRPANRLYLNTMTRATCRRAAAIITGSQAIADEIKVHLGAPAERVHVIPDGVAQRFQPLPHEQVEAFRSEYLLPERFILFMGTLEPRKNLVTLVRAFARLHDPHVHLVLAGGKGWYYEDLFAEVSRLELEARVHFPGYVPAEQQTLWYNAATAFAYVSHYEGFGLPVVEALACGTPTLISQAGALCEVAQDSALTVPAEDEAAIADGLHRLLTDAPMCAQLRQRGLARVAAFTWDATAARTAALYRHVLQSN